LKKSEVKALLDEAFVQFSTGDFIAHDPVQIPHAFSKKQDIEIAGFFAATLAWGQRITIINKCRELFDLMDNDPHQFILHHSDSDLRGLLKFKHRTFNTTDLLYFIQFLNFWYSKNESLEIAFTKNMFDSGVEGGLIGFHELFFSLPDYPERTKKHVATPARKSACKRLNMFLRWMVREDHYGIDFGLWKNISPSQLICPFDLHVANVSRKLKLVKRKQNDWQAAMELTSQLRKFEAEDPVKYDIALFGLGVYA
jgi:uncharacterized protein (TIGR02757 family)